MTVVKELLALKYFVTKVFLKMGQSRPLIVYFRYFLITISIIEKSIDGELGIRTRGRRMVGADETTELWRPQSLQRSLGVNLSQCEQMVRLF